MKLCKDCKHFQEEPEEFGGDAALGEQWGRCKLKIGVNPVNGMPKKDGRSLCAVERMYPPLMALLSRECGESGRYWEAK